MFGRRWPFAGRAQDLERLDALLEVDHLALPGVCDPRGVVLVGDAGVGKTRLLTEFIERARIRGFRVRLVQANGSAAAVPFAALTDVLQPDDAMSTPRIGPETLFQEAVARLVAEATSGQPWLLAIDDVHHLDQPSAAALQQCLLATGAGVVATLCIDGRCPDAFDSLIRSGMIERQPVGALDDATLERLADHVLDVTFGAPFDEWSCRRLVTLAAGNPLGLRQLVEAVRDTGAYRRLGDGWTLTGEFTGASQLTTLVADRLAALSTAQCRVLELVALGEPVTMAVLEQLVDGSDIDELLERGLLTSSDLAQHGETQLRCAHPLFAEVLTDRLPPTRRHRRAEELLSVLPATIHSGPAQLRRALLQLDANVDDPGSLAAAAASARYIGDQETAIRLAEGALAAADGDGTERTAAAYAALTHASVSVARGLSTPAEAFPAALRRATAPAERVNVLGEWIWATLVREGPDAALDVLASVSKAVTDRVERLAVDTLVATVVGHSGQWRAAHRAAVALLDKIDDAIDPIQISVTARCLAAISAAFAGPIAPALIHAEHMITLAGETPTLFPNQVFCGQAGYLYALSYQHGFAAMVARAERSIEDCLRGTSHLELAGLWYGVLGNQAVSMGVVNERSRWWCDQALRHLAACDPCGLTSFAVGARAMHAVLSGDLTTAEQHLDLYDARFRRVEAKTTVHADRGRAWLAFRRGRLAEAVERSLDAWAAAWERADVALWAAPSAHDLVRFGRPDLAVPLLEQADDALGCRFSAALVAHAQAVESCDESALIHAAAGFGALGAVDLQAESLALAAKIAGPTGRVTSSISSADYGDGGFSSDSKGSIATSSSDIGREAAGRGLPGEPGHAHGLRLERSGSRWTVRFGGESVVVRNLAGVRYIAALVGAAGRWVPATQLAGATIEISRQPVLDDAARRDLQRRGVAVAEALEAARAAGDTGRVAPLEDEADAIVAELRRATGVRGGDRCFADPGERARTAVRKAIVRALAEIAEGCPAAADYLAARITTGYSCQFVADPANEREHGDRRALNLGF